MSGLSGTGLGSYSPYAVQQYQQSLFNQIDSSGDGSISKAELEQAVTTAGGTIQAADALFSKLDPNNTGSVSEQQFAQTLPGPPFSGQMQAQMIGYQAQGWPGSSTTDPGIGIAQSLFAQIDGNGDGSISKAELEQAVTAAGGTAQAADALFTQLDPNNTGSVSEQQFAQGLSQAMPHHHHHHHGGAAASTDGNGAADALASLFNADSGPGTSPLQIAQNLFSQIDGNGDGSISKTELEQSVTAAGGTTQSADALFTQLDPGNTGSISEQQFIQALQPPSASGNTAADALLALLQSGPPSAPGASAAVNTAAAPPVNAPAGGNTAQDALAALLPSFDSSANDGFGNGAQDALLALLNNSGASAIGAAGNTDALLTLLQATSGLSSNGTGSSSATGAVNSSNLALAISLYQAQLNQQLFGGMV